MVTIHTNELGVCRTRNQSRLQADVDRGVRPRGEQARRVLGATTEELRPGSFTFSCPFFTFIASSETRRHHTGIGPSALPSMKCRTTGSALSTNGSHQLGRTWSVTPWQEPHAPHPFATRAIL